MEKNFKTTTAARTGDGRRGVAGGIAISSFHRHGNSVCRTDIVSIS